MRSCWLVVGVVVGVISSACGTPESRLLDEVESICNEARAVLLEAADSAEAYADESGDSDVEAESTRLRDMAVSQEGVCNQQIIAVMREFDEQGAIATPIFGMPAVTEATFPRIVEELVDEVKAYLEQSQQRAQWRMALDVGQAIKTELMASLEDAKGILTDDSREPPWQPNRFSNYLTDVENLHDRLGDRHPLSRYTRRGLFDFMGTTLIGIDLIIDECSDALSTLWWIQTPPQRLVDHLNSVSSRDEDGGEDDRNQAEQLERMRTEAMAASQLQRLGIVERIGNVLDTATADACSAWRDELEAELQRG